MSKFIDKSGNEWNLELNLGMIEDITEQTGVDLDKLLTKPAELAKIILADPKKIVEILYITCEEQIKERNLEPREFGRLFNRETLDKASEAFFLSILSFYPRSSAGKVITDRFPELMKKMDDQIIKGLSEKMTVLLNSDTNTRG